MDETAVKVHPLQQLEGKTRERFNAIMMILCLVVCFVTGGGAGWFGHWFLSPPTFSEAQQELISQGYANAAEHLGEIERACPNGKQMKTACRLLLMNSEEISSKAQIAMNVPGDAE